MLFAINSICSANELRTEKASLEWMILTTKETLGVFMKTESRFIPR